MDARLLRDRANEALARGRFAQAAELLEQCCALEPQDALSRLRLGDTWAKAGEPARAIAAYEAAAEGFAREGLLPRAIATSKRLLELDPSHRGVQRKLASLYALRGAPAEPRAALYIELPPEIDAALEADLPDVPPPTPASTRRLRGARHRSGFSPDGSASSAETDRGIRVSWDNRGASSAARPTPGSSIESRSRWARVDGSRGQRCMPSRCARPGPRPARAAPRPRAQAFLGW